jgi:signal transduction histidine kinase
VSTSPANLPRAAESADPAFLDRLLDGAGLAVFVCDLKGGVRPMSDVAVAIAAAIETPTERLPDLLPSEFRPRAEEALETVSRTREPVDFTARVLADATGRTYVVRLTPIFSSEGKLQRIAAWLLDAGDRSVRPEAGRTSEKLASLGAVSGAMAHHYNNLLCCIATSVDHAMNMNTMAAMRRTLQRAQSSITRAADLTRQLLAFAQADHRAEHFADLLETILYYYDENENRLRDRRVQLQLDWRPGPFRAVPREELMLILENITSNALDAMPQGGMLFVSLDWQGDEAVITIEDTGTGLPPHVIQHLFEPFFTTRGELAQGDSRRAGMGLAVTYGLVREMGGSIRADSPPGRGARFEIRMPPRQR